MSNNKLSLSDYFSSEEVSLAKRIFVPFYDKLFLTEAVNYKDAVLLSIYMACNLKRSSSVEREEAKAIYQIFGRKNADYFKVYLARLVKNEFIIREGDNLSLTSKGYARIKELLGNEFGIKTFLIKGGELYTGKRGVEEQIFKQLSGVIYICDPYCDVTTLDFFTEINNNVTIQVLTKSVKDVEKFKRRTRDLMEERKNLKLEIRQHVKEVLHDRFIVIKDKEIAYSVGTSLNGIGKKDTVITELPKDIFDALVELFEHRWKEANQIFP